MEKDMFSFTQRNYFLLSARLRTTEKPLRNNSLCKVVVAYSDCHKNYKNENDLKKEKKRKLISTIGKLATKIKRKIKKKKFKQPSNNSRHNVGAII